MSLQAMVDYERKLNASLKSMTQKKASNARAAKPDAFDDAKPAVTPPAFNPIEKKEPKSMLIVEEIETPKAPALSAIQASIDTSKLLRDFQSAIDLASARSAESSASYTKQLIDGLMDDVEKRLSGFGNPPKLFAKIQIDTRVLQLADDQQISEQTMQVISDILVNVKAGLNTMLVGPAGSGKTTLAAMVAKMLDRPFGSISWTGGMSETPALMGRQFADRVEEAEWSKMYRKPGLFLHDEFDKADPNAGCKVNMATENGRFYNDVTQQMVLKHPEFTILAACNTAGRGGDHVYAGANPLDGSTLSRFVMVPVDYDPVYERRVCPDKAIYELLLNARKRLKDLKATEILSTRQMIQVYNRHALGTPLARCIASMVLGWPDELVDQCGLNASDVAKVKAGGSK